MSPNPLQRGAPPPSHTRGVYFLANDRVLDLALPFLRSFRRYNPDLPLCLMPYDDQISRLSGLAAELSFSIFPSTPAMTECDRISARFHGQVWGHYRKLALWEGPFDQFVYIDVDTVVLASLDWVWDLLADFSFVVGQSNGTLAHVWRQSIYSTRRLEPDQIGFAGNTGFIVSERGALTVEAGRQALDSALELAPHMQLYTVEQPFLNYLIVTSGKAYTSLEVLALKRDYYPRVHVEWWAGKGGRRVAEGTLLEDDGPPVLFVHWAGLWQPRPVDRLLFQSLRALGLASGDAPVIRYAMPYASLWRYYNRPF